MADCYDDYFNDTQNLDPTGEAEDAAAEVIGKIPEPTEIRVGDGDGGVVGFVTS